MIAGVARDLNGGHLPSFEGHRHHLCVSCCGALEVGVWRQLEVFEGFQERVRCSSGRRSRLLVASKERDHDSKAAKMCELPSSFCQHVALDLVETRLLVDPFLEGELGQLDADLDVITCTLADEVRGVVGSAHGRGERIGLVVCAKVDAKSVELPLLVTGALLVVGTGQWA